MQTDRLVRVCQRVGHRAGFEVEFGHRSDVRRGLPVAHPIPRSAGTTRHPACGNRSPGWPVRTRCHVAKRHDQHRPVVRRYRHRELSFRGDLPDHDGDRPEKKSHATQNLSGGDRNLRTVVAKSLGFSSRRRRSISSSVRCSSFDSAMRFPSFVIPVSPSRSRPPLQCAQPFSEVPWFPQL